ncbi:MAG: hypothetical protein ACM3TN_20040 [Alphaproteobacteria bacterium]
MGSSTDKLALAGGAQKLMTSPESTIDMNEFIAVHLRESRAGV